MLPIDSKALKSRSTFVSNTTKPADLMFSIFKKTKITEDQLANYFVTSIVQLTENGFEDVCEIINNDTEFVHCPNLDKSNYDQFLLIVFAGNLQMMGKHFEQVKDVRITEKIYRKLAGTFSTEPALVKEVIAKYQSWMARVNHPSKNTNYAMSKAIFFKYELNQFQKDYFKNMNTPNPIFLKRLDEVVSQFIFNWQTIEDDYRVTEG